jgi:chromosome segregation ATPase
MTAENQALLDSIRTIVVETVTQAVAPIVERLDILTERVGALTERVGALTERMDALTERMDALTERMDALTERTERIESEQRDQRTLLNTMATQVSSLALHVARHDSLLETIDSRTNQMETDLFDIHDRLRQVEDRVRDGFHGLKQDISAAFSDIRALRKTQARHDKTVASLRDSQGGIHQRLSALEGSRG